MKISWLVAAGVLAISGCGVQGSGVSADSETVSDACTALTGEPSVTGEGGKAIVRADDRVSVETFQAWLKGRAVGGAPSLTDADFPELKGSTMVEICVFEVDPRPVPGPPDVEREANGARVLVGDGGWDVFGLGPLETLLTESRELASTADKLQEG